MKRFLPALLVSTAGCVTFVRPPDDPRDPVTAAIVDYGYHSSLVLPLPDGGSIEYAYGSWGWFALNHDDWTNACSTLCWPNRGALGRRRRADPGGRRLEFRVAREDVDRLVRRLEERFQGKIDTRIFNPQLGLELVEDDVDYCFFVNCNHLVARWLRELGCEVTGSACFSNFRLEDPDPTYHR